MLGEKYNCGCNVLINGRTYKFKQNQDNQKSYEKPKQVDSFEPTKVDFEEIDLNLRFSTDFRE